MAGDINWTREHMWAQQGWQCPCCQRVYSPTTPMCYYCPTQVKVQDSTSQARARTLAEWNALANAHPSEKGDER